MTTATATQSSANLGAHNGVSFTEAIDALKSSKAQYMYNLACRAKIEALNSGHIGFADDGNHHQRANAKALPFVSHNDGEFTVNFFKPAKEEVCPTTENYEGDNALQELRYSLGMWGKNEISLKVWALTSAIDLEPENRITLS